MSDYACWSCRARRAAEVAGRAAAADLVERLRPVAEADGEPAAEVDPGTAPRGTVH